MWMMPEMSDKAAMMSKMQKMITKLKSTKESKGSRGNMPYDKYLHATTKNKDTEGMDDGKIAVV